MTYISIVASFEKDPKHFAKLTYRQHFTMSSIQPLMCWNGVRLFNDAKQHCTAMQGKKKESQKEDCEEFLVGF